MSCTELRNVVKDLLKDFTARTHKELDYLSRMELRRPIVQNEEEYDTIKDRIQQTIANEKVLSDDTFASYGSEIDVVCHVFTYFAMSSKRYIVNVPMVLETRFAKDYSDELQSVFSMRLRITGENGRANSERYYRENEMIRVKREDLMRREKLLEKAIEIYEDILNDSL